MESLEQIIETLFGGSISVDKITTILVAIFAVIKAFTEWHAKKKLIIADKELSSADKKLAAQEKELQETKQCVSLLCNVMTTAFLASNTLDDTAKKKIAAYTLKAEEISNIDLTSMTVQLIDTVNTYIPGTNLNDKKEAIKAEVKSTEEVLDKAIEGTVSAIDAINL
jgi:hypothetical protein